MMGRRRACVASRERFDMVVAAKLLLLLMFGWAIRLDPVEQWPGAVLTAIALLTRSRLIGRRPFAERRIFRQFLGQQRRRTCARAPG